MRVLGIETSAAARGTVALAEGGVRLAEASHEVRSAHAELMLPLIARLLAEAGWARGSLDRLAVGVGPGSFTGVRVGIALAQGIALGLGVPVVGVPSLAAMARAAPPHVSGLRVPLLDARRGEVFAAAYDEHGVERLAARALPRATALAELDGLVGPARVLLGAVAVELAGPASSLRSPETDLPHAALTALLGGELEPGAHPPEPLYVRDAGATRPVLRPSPLG